MTNNRDERRYRKWESDHEKRGTSELIPAATVVIMRDSESAIELLMLRKNSKVAFLIAVSRSHRHIQNDRTNCT